MTALRRLAASAAVLALAAAPALADPDGPVTHTDQLVVVTPNPPVLITNGAGPSTVAPTPPAYAPDAPQNEPWDNVSHINGTPVKVGERGDYLKAYKKLNISSNPIGWMFGVYGVSISEAISANVAIRGDANWMSIEDEHGYEVGLSAPIFFRRVYSGPFVEPGIIARGTGDEGGYRMTGPEVLFGWSWIFDSGLNVAAAFGTARNLTTEDTDPEPAGYFRIGYAM